MSTFIAERHLLFAVLGDDHRKTLIVRIDAPRPIEQANRACSLHTQTSAAPQKRPESPRSELDALAFFLRSTLLGRIRVVIPALVRRELEALQTRSIAPLISASRTNPAGPERVPFGSTAVPRAQPQVVLTRAPLALGAVDFRRRHWAFLSSA